MFRSKAAIQELDKAVAELVRRNRRLDERCERFFAAHEAAVTEIQSLKARLATLEHSDFAKNRADYERERVQLAESMPDIPLWPD